MFSDWRPHRLDVLKMFSGGGRVNGDSLAAHFLAVKVKAENGDRENDDYVDGNFCIIRQVSRLGGPTADWLLMVTDFR